MVRGEREVHVGTGWMKLGREHISGDAAKRNLNLSVLWARCQRNGNEDVQAVGQAVSYERRQLEPGMGHDY